jgi:hypothetical protein
MRKRREELERRASDLYSEIARIELMQQANQGAMKQRGYILEKQSRDFDETTLVQEFKIAEQGVDGLSADLYDTNLEIHAVNDAILERLLLAKKESRPANDVDGDGDHEPVAEAAE